MSVVKIEDSINESFGEANLQGLIDNISDEINLLPERQSSLLTNRLARLIA